MNTGIPIIEYAVNIAFALLALAMILTFVRLALGPTLPDRIVALDLIASQAIGMVITLAFYSGEVIYVDIAVFIALIVFIGTVAISKYLKRTYYDK